MKNIKTIYKSLFLIGLGLLLSANISLAQDSWAERQEKRADMMEDQIEALMRQADHIPEAQRDNMIAEINHLEEHLDKVESRVDSYDHPNESDFEQFKYEIADAFQELGDEIEDATREIEGAIADSH